MLRKFLLTVLFSTLLLSRLALSATTPEVGQVAPQFSLSTPDGKMLTLSQFTQKGTVVLVVLRGYPGYQCPFCVKQVHDFIVNADKLSAARAEVILVYPGPPADLDQHAREALAKQNPLPANIHLVIDPNYTFTNLYGLRWDAPNETAYPSTFLVDRKGVIFFRKISPRHGDRSSADDVFLELQKATPPTK
jgi:peroxiredoxin